jgi:hypothetical protein
MQWLPADVLGMDDNTVSAGISIICANRKTPLLLLSKSLLAAPP